MGIKRKRTGPAPNAVERWQQLALDPKRLNEARQEYRTVYPKVSLVEAHRIVRDYAIKNKKS